MYIEDEISVGPFFLISALFSYLTSIIVLTKYYCTQVTDQMLFDIDVFPNNRWWQPNNNGKYVRHCQPRIPTEPIANDSPILSG